MTTKPALRNDLSVLVSNLVPSVSLPIAGDRPTLGSKAIYCAVLASCVYGIYDSIERLSREPYNPISYVPLGLVAVVGTAKIASHFIPPRKAYKRLPIPRDVHKALQVLPRSERREAKEEIEGGLTEAVAERYESSQPQLAKALLDYAVRDYQQRGLYLEAGKVARLLGNETLARECFDKIIDEDIALGLGDAAIQAAREKGGLEEEARMYLKAGVPAFAADTFLRIMEGYRQRHDQRNVERLRKEVKPLLKKILEDNPKKPGLEEFVHALWNMTSAVEERALLALGIPAIQKIIPLEKILDCYVAAARKTGSHLWYQSAAELAGKLGKRELAEQLLDGAIITKAELF